MKHQSINRRRDTKFAVALDAEQNNIQVKDIVKVIDGPHSVRERFDETEILLSRILWFSQVISFSKTGSRG